MFGNVSIERPLAIDASAGGRLAVLDLEGRRVCIAGAEPIELERRAARMRFRGEILVLLDHDGLLRTMQTDGTPIGALQGRPGALDLAVLPSGSVLVSHADRLERVGESPLEFSDPRLPAEGVLAAEAGGVWVCGAAGAVRLRPVAGAAGYQLIERVPLPSSPHAAAIGPDGSLFLLVGPSLLRLGGEAHRLDRVATGLARHEGRLLACGPGGVFDLTAFVPPPDPEGPRYPELPPCS